MCNLEYSSRFLWMAEKGKIMNLFINHCDHYPDDVSGQDIDNLFQTMVPCDSCGDRYEKDKMIAGECVRALR